MTTTPSDRGTDTDEADTDLGPTTGAATGKGKGAGTGKDEINPFHQAHGVPATTTGGGG